MIKELENIAQQIANSRTRLTAHAKDPQKDLQIIFEAKCMESIESNLRDIINELGAKIKEMLG